MNKLRILPLAFVCGFRPSGQKGPRATKLMKWLIALLLLWPAFASAACSPSGDVFTQICSITSGTATYQFDNEWIDFHFAGNGFSGTGYFLLPDQNPFPIFVRAPGPFALGIELNADLGFFGDTPPDLVLTELTVNGVPQPLPTGAGFPAAGMFFHSNVPLITGAGTFSGWFLSSVYYEEPQFNMIGFLGNPDFGFTTVDVVPYPRDPSFLEIAHETWTWSAPEPATLSLFALGLAGVGFMRRRKAIVP